MFFSLLLITLFGHVSCQIIPNTLCTDNFNNDACQQIARDQEMTCQLVPTKTDCILDADLSLPTLSVLTAEEAFLASGIVSENVVVIGEILEGNVPYRTVVIVKSDYLGGVGDQLKGLKYCHPGYDHDKRITRFVLEELDWKAVSLNCEDDKTLTELKYKAFSEFYGDSCRPGTWTEDYEFDAFLKNKYPSLCKLCSSETCSSYTVPLNDSLTCLTNGGDVALSDLSYANAFFEIGSNSQNYRYLCPNGTLTTSLNPCVWTSQLNRVLITSRQSASTMESYLKSKMPSYVVSVDSTGSTSLERHLAHLLQLSNTDKINLLLPTSLNSYVSAQRTFPISPSICNRILKWSVTTELENRKCQWLQQASITHGLLPPISCVQSEDNDTLSSLDNIAQKGADVTFIDANYGYIARRKQLSNAAYPETDVTKLSKIVIVVRNETDWYKELKDFSGKGICLPSYGGKEWLAFIDLLRKNNVIQNSIDYGAIFSSFVGESCTPGANYKDLDIANTNSQKLCSNCVPIDITETARYCNAEPNNKYYNSRGALKCLENGAGDYAVISLNDLPEYYIKRPENQLFRIISKNGSLSNTPGLTIDENAPIAIIISGEVVFNNVTPSTYNDTILYLKHMEVEFGENLDKAFKVFESFNHTKNLLFPDSTPGLTFEGSSNQYIGTYKTLLSNSEISGPVVNGVFQPSYPAIFIVLVITFFAQLI
ncbi:hypothetical protein ABEB36_012670 [Hypothenemus hampei]|uniref:Transferrin-like domain-containing protein n=1 Tax=Hypothenemus hampei TaxID=57062 RepID=A0ABD1EC84_HYPHA